MKNKYHVLLIVLVWLAGLNFAAAGNVALGWNPSSSPDVAGYNVYYGTNSGSYTESLFAGNVTTTTISNLTAGVTFYFAATTVDANGNESAFSNEATAVVPEVLTISQGANPGDPMLVEFPVTAGHCYEVQATTDFQSWTTIWQTDVATSNGCVQFADPNSSRFSSRFYRLVLH